MMIYSSTQHPAKVQQMVAKVLAVPLNLIVVEVSRMGGAFGGKESQAVQWACIAALLAQKTQRPVKLRLSRRDDFIMTGKRHPFCNHYRAGFGNDGCIQGIEITVNANCGHSPDLSDAIVERAMFHVDNAYYLDNVRVEGNRCKTNTVSNTAFRGFGGPQGMLIIESILDDIARYLHKDPLEIRKANFYGLNERNITHYHQKVEHNFLPEIVLRLEQSAQYYQRRKEIVIIQTPLTKGSPGTENPARL
jgi:xanthine dehydrogenase large subunit